jgi:hypothetical protein
MDPSSPGAQEPPSDLFAPLLGPRRGGSETEAERLSRDHGVTVVPAVVVVCEHCDSRSQPMDPAEVESWAASHSGQHANEILVRHMAQEGHAMQVIVEWMDPDDSGGHAECSCSWRSRTVKTCNAGDLGLEHLREVLAGS